MSIVGIAHAVTYYVTKSGNDSNTCTQAQTLATAKLTIAAGVGCLSSGDTVIIGAGTYDENMILSPPSGSPGSPTTIMSDTGATVIIQPTSFPAGDASFFHRILIFPNGTHHVTVSGLEIDGTSLPADGLHSVTLIHTNDDSHDLIFENMNLHDSRGDAIHMMPSSYGNTVRNSNMYDVGASVADTSPAHCIYMRGPTLEEVPIDSPTLSNTPGNLVEGNTFTGPSDDICLMQRGDQVNNVIRKNRFFSGDVPIMIGNTSQNTLFYNNIIANNENCIRLEPSSTGKVYNNTFYNSGNTDAFKCFPNIGQANLGSTPAQHVRNNIFYITQLNGTIPADNFVGDPSFTDAGNLDFTLQASSAAIDYGTTLSEVPDDFIGTSRSKGAAYDAGAYEYAGTPEIGEVGISDTHCPNWAATKANTSGRTISTNNTTIDYEEITGQMFVNAENVTFDCVRINAQNNLYGLSCLTSNCAGLLIEDSEILDGTSASLILRGTANNRAITRRSHIRGDENDAMKIRGHAELIDSFVEVEATPGSHNDAIQIESGVNIDIRGNTIAGPLNEQTSAIIAKSDFGIINNLRLENNTFSGGTHTIYSVNGGFGVPTNVIVANNVWVKDSWKFSPVSFETNASHCLEWYGNTNSDGTVRGVPTSSSPQGECAIGVFEPLGGSTPQNAPVTFTPAPGTYATTVTVSMSTPTAGATIYYTTDGSTPDATDTAYSTPVVLSATTTLKAIAIKAGNDDSVVTTGTYTIAASGCTY